MKHRPRQFGAESFRELWCMEGKFCSRLFWIRGSETTFEHENQNSNDDHAGAQDAHEEHGPGYRPAPSGSRHRHQHGARDPRHSHSADSSAPRTSGQRFGLVSTCPGAACRSCRVSSVLRSIAGRVRVSRSRRSHGRGRACGVPVAAHHEGKHAQGICWADHRQSRGQMPVNGYRCQGCLRPTRRRRRRPGWPGLSLKVEIRS